MVSTSWFDSNLVPRGKRPGLVVIHAKPRKIDANFKAKLTKRANNIDRGQNEKEEKSVKDNGFTLRAQSYLQAAQVQFG